LATDKIAGRSKIGVFPYLLRLHYRFYNMTVAQLKWMSCCIVVPSKMFSQKLLLNCFH